jgi:hypothetical protein
MSPDGLPIKGNDHASGIMVVGARSSRAYKKRHANSAPKIRLATMASHKARDACLSPRTMLMWLVIMMPAVSASQSQNIPAPSEGKVAAAGSQHLIQPRVP